MENFTAQFLPICRRTGEGKGNTKTVSRGGAEKKQKTELFNRKERKEHKENGALATDATRIKTGGAGP
jgi:hypothetical protein